MEVVSTRNELNTIVDIWQSQELSSGFVPTMGALHEGHLSLIRRAAEENDRVTASIFVNPLQFNNPEDLEKYPRDLDTDLMKLEEAGCGLVFTPPVEEMYPDAVTESIELGLIDQVMEGSHRPGHFRGVAIVVERLFRLMRPTRAYFGEKDYQQLMVIRELVRQAALPVEIVPCPTIRESDGLAMSSRNLRLSTEQRAHAPYLHAILLDVRRQFGTTDAEYLASWAFDRLKENPWFEPEYFEIRDQDTLALVTGDARHEGARAFVVASMGDVRLIDNMGLS